MGTNIEQLMNGAKPLVGVPVWLDTVVMGVDPSIVATGIAVVWGGRMKSFTVSAPSKMAGVERLAWLADEVGDILDRYAPSLVGIEGYSFGSRNSHAHSLGEVGGAYRLALWRRCMQTIEMPPLSLKKFSAGAGNVEKSVVAKELFKRYGVDVANNNEADAAGLSIAAMAYSNPDDFALTKAQKDALAKMAKLSVQPVANSFDKRSVAC